MQNQKKNYFIIKMEFLDLYAPMHKVGLCS